MAASLDRIDALVFTGGVGENSPEIRRRALDGLIVLGPGVAIDTAANERGSRDRRLDTNDAGAAVLVVESREDLEIDRQVRIFLGGQVRGPATPSV
jgi:acetate kinase